MRDPIRIQRILNKLAAAWQAMPDLRLGQLVSHATNPCLKEYDGLWLMEDDEFERKLDEWLVERGITVSGG